MENWQKVCTVQADKMSLILGRDLTLNSTKFLKRSESGTMKQVTLSLFALRKRNKGIQYSINKFFDSK